MALTEQSETIKNHEAFIWSVADLLRGDYKQSEYGRIILPLTVLRRLDCVLEPTKAKVIERAAKVEGTVENPQPLLRSASGHDFYNTHTMTLTEVLDDPGNLADQLRAYIARFSPNAREILEKFEFDPHIDKLERSNLLYQVLGKFCEIDLHPDTVSPLEMGYLYEELIRRFSELSNETAGEHFTPREVIRLMVNLLFAEDGELLAKPGIVRTMLDPACGTGGMLSVAQDHLRRLNEAAQLEVFGQELNAETYAVCRSDLLLKGENADRIVHGNSFSEDGHDGATFDYLLANPPFGVEWKKVKEEVTAEHEAEGFAGRFGAGLPRINDGSFLFLQHMIDKMKPVAADGTGGSRLAIVFNGSPLFTGGAGSGESEIRRWIIENDWLDAVVALPDQLFYNTGISTYFWIVTNRKSPQRQGKVQLIDARDLFVKMRKSLGEKRKEIGLDQIDEITRLYGEFTEGDRVKIFPSESFGFMRITVERPKRIRWECGEEQRTAIEADKKLAKLDESVRADLLAGLTDRHGLSTRDREVAAAKLDPVLDGLDLTAAQRKAVWANLEVRDDDADPVTNKKGEPQPDTDLRDQENVPLPEGGVAYEHDITARLADERYRTAMEEYLEAEVLPWVPDAWIDHAKTKIGYEIPLTRHFYQYEPPRPLEEIDAEIKQLEQEISELMAEVVE